MLLSSKLKRALVMDLGCLALAAPFLYFPTWFPPWAPIVSYVVLALGWISRRRRLGIWQVRTPADWAVFLLFFVMLPISVAVAPEALRIKYSIPRAHILVWNFYLFGLVVTYATYSHLLARWLGLAFVVLGTSISLLAPLGIKWAVKMPIMVAVLGRIPTPLLGVFQGAESGFSPNQVAGAILYVVPVALALVCVYCRSGWRNWECWLLLFASGLMLIVLGLTQSRAGFLGLAAGVSALILLGLRRGRWIFTVGIAVAIAVIVLGFGPLTTMMNNAPSDSAASSATIVSRTEIWSRAIYGLYDFSFTGMGLGTFRSVIWQLYPLSLTSLGSDIAHAHNFFLQQGLDFGIPGLVALISVYIAAAIQIMTLWGCKAHWRAWSLGFAAALVAQVTYSFLDAVTMGSKVNFLFWMLLALIMGMGNHAALARQYQERESAN